MRGGSSRVRGGSIRLRGSRVRGGSSQVRGGNSRVRGGSSRLRGGSSRVRGSSSRVRGGSSRLRGGSSRVRGGSSRVRGGSSRVRVVNDGIQYRLDNPFPFQVSGLFRPPGGYIVLLSVTIGTKLIYCFRGLKALGLAAEPSCGHCRAIFSDVRPSSDILHLVNISVIFRPTTWPLCFVIQVV